MNPELYKMYSYYIPFTSHTNINTNTNSNSNSSTNTISHLRSQSTPPISNKHHHRTNMGPRRRNPNFLKPQYTHINDIKTHKLVPIIKEKHSNNNSNKTKNICHANMRTYEGHIAPAHANV